MSASKVKRSVWSRIMGLFKAPETAPELVAAHLRSMTPEAAARLMGPGSMPPRANKITAPAIAPAVAPAHQDMPLASEMPLPLLRATGVFQTEHAKFDRALAHCAAELVTQLGIETASVSLQLEEISSNKVLARKLAGQLAVVARLNQPSSRAGTSASVKSSASKAAAKSALAKHAAPVSSKRTLLTANVKSGHDIYTRPQAVVIDLAAVKVLRRSEKARRAA